MAKFFLHIRDGDTLIEDPEGIDVPDLEAARKEAILAARDIVADRVRDGKAIDGEVFEIWNDGRILATVPFKDMIELR